MAYHCDQVRLEKGMYREAGRTFSQVLEQLDPSEQYRGTALEGLDAFQRQLKRFDIRVKGAGSDLVDKFFSTSQSAVLFPEYIARAVKVGIEESNVLPEITATETHIEGMDYRSITSVPEDEKKLKRVAEGASIPQTTVKTQSNLVRLHKRGRMLVASYEAIRFQKLDLFSVTLRQIGAQIGRMHLEDAVNVILNGDGNDNPAATVNVATSGTLKYDDLLNFWNGFDPYQLNTLLVGSDTMVKLLSLSQMQDAAAGLSFHGTGKLITPMGAKVLRTEAVPAGKIIGLDKHYALEMVKAGDVSVEYDKLIDRQLERAAITTISGYAKIFADASQVLAI
ncbi:MAG TPA: phage major capsid protein [Candidatus Enterenecus merdae]|nr:phage major capsid protein [Candidatus Enterenecus merdae]